MHIWRNTSSALSHSSSQLNSPDGWQFRSLDFQIIRLLLHLKFSENQGNGVPWVCQDGPLTLPTAAKATSTSTSTSARGVTAREIKAGDEPAGAPQGATARVLRCQSPKKKAEWEEQTHGLWVISVDITQKVQHGGESGFRHKTSVPVPSDEYNVCQVQYLQLIPQQLRIAHMKSMPKRLLMAKSI